jgi:hypothetical protein
MAELAFLDDDKLFDGECVRFTGTDGEAKVLCGVTTAALQARDAALPHYGLIPAEAFLESYERYMTEIHTAARVKYGRGQFETDRPVRVLVDRSDLCP